jgi:ArsR family transcriptional regulator, arsenate/arsenite/antimonite-responsive transcriptional repressor
MEDETSVRAFRALSDPTRLRILDLLSSCCCGTAALREDGAMEELTAGEVCCRLTGAERITSTVSHHLHELEGAGLIRIERRGKSAVCTLRPEALVALSDRLRALAQGAGEGRC